MLGLRALGEAALGEGPRDGAADPRVLHAEMLRRITALENALAKLSPPAGSIGHNLSPEPIEGEPFTVNDYASIRDAIAVLKSQNHETIKPSSETIAAVNSLQSSTSKLGKFLVEKGDIFVTEFVKAAGASTGKWAPRLILLAIAYVELNDLIQAATKYLQALPPS